MKLSKISFTAAVTLSMLFSGQIYAQDIQIPDKMAPNSVVEYNQDLEMNVKEFSVMRSAYRMSELSGDENIVEPEAVSKEFLVLEQKILMQNEDAEQKIELHIEKIKPEVGMKVYYDDEGYIDSIEYAPFSSSRYSPLRRGTTSPVGTYVGGIIIIHLWLISGMDRLHLIGKN